MMPDSNTASQDAALRTRPAAILGKLLAAHPLVPRSAAIGLALLGYVVPLLFPGAALILSVHLIGLLTEGGLGAAVGNWAALASLGISAAMAWSLWRLPVDEPGGEPLDARQAPALFEQVAQLREAFQAPAIADIHLIDSGELEIRRVPRNGYPFLVRQVLLIGLPALQCLSVEQFKCLLATRLGELSSVRADVAGWTNQLVGTLRQLQQAVSHRRQPAALLYRGFLAVYLPLLSMLAQRLDSDRRLRRDHYALEVASDDLVVELFAGEIVMQRFLDEHYWPTVYRAAEHSPEPNFKVFRNLEPVFRKHLGADRIQIWLREAYVGKWRGSARDPDLRTRLHEIGHGELRYCRPGGPSAAQTLLGASQQWIIDRCDARWAEEHHGEWRACHEKSRRRHERLRVLSGKLEGNGLHGEEAMEYAALIKRYGTAGEALEAHRAILETNPDDAQINFGVGKYLLACHDPGGVAVLEHAMALDKRYVDPACRLISAYRTGQRNQAARASVAGGGA